MKTEFLMQLGLSEEIAAKIMEEVGEEALLNKIATLEGEIAKTENIQAQLAKEQALTDSFKQLTADKKFVNDLTKGGIFEEFKKAAQAGEAGQEEAIFAQITKDRGDIFENENKVVALPGMNQNLAPLEEQALTYSQMVRLMG